MWRKGVTNSYEAIRDDRVDVSRLNVADCAGMLRSARDPSLHNLSVSPNRLLELSPSDGPIMIGMSFPFGPSIEQKANNKIGDGTSPKWCGSTHSQQSQNAQATPSIIIT